ncbi:MAG: hypothetical protein QNK32_09805 [Porticoccus sp.]|nr:hypothetical protein [Porticoccus sp.]
MKPIKALIAGLAISATLLFSMAGMATNPEDHKIMVIETVDVNTKNPLTVPFNTLVTLLISGTVIDDESLMAALGNDSQYRVLPVTDGAFNTLFDAANSSCNSIDLLAKPGLVIKYRVDKSRSDLGKIATHQNNLTLQSRSF